MRSTALTIAGVLAIASFPGYARAQSVPIMGGTWKPFAWGCTDTNGNEGLFYWVGREPRCGLSPAKPKTYVAERDRGCETMYQRNTSEYEACIADDQEPPASPPPASPPPPRVTVTPPYQGPPPIGWVYQPYTQCGNPPQCSMGMVNVDASGLNVRTVPNGPPVMSLVNGTPLYALQKQGDWLLVAPACDLTPTWAWSWNAGVPLNRCWVYF
jgi:hypothetical protein